MIPRARTVSCVIVFLTLTSSAAGATNWALAERNDGAIRARVEKLRSVLGDVVSEGEARILSDELYMNVDVEGHVIMRNRVIQVLGDPTPYLSRREVALPPGYDLATVAGFIIRSDDVLRFDRDDLQTTETGSAEGQLVLEFPSIRPGDVFGYSVSLKATGVMPAAQLPLVEDLPVAYGMMRIKTDGNVYYSFSLENLDESRGRIEELERQNARPTDIKVRYGPIDVVDDPIFSRPYYFRQPRCTIRLRGFHRRGARWSEIGTWEQVAEYYAYDVYSWLRNSDRLLAETALAQFDTTATAFEKADSVFRWVRDDLRLAESEIAQGSFRDPDEVVESGFATEYEKTFVMAAILHKLDVTPRLALIRAPAAGPIDRSVPGTDQFTALLIMVGQNAAFRMYIPSDPAAEPGFVPPPLRGGELFVPNVWRAKEEREKRRRFWLTIMGESMELDLTDPDVKFEEDAWFAWGRVPGDPMESVGRIREEVHHRGSGRGSDRRLVSTGYTGLLDAARRGHVDDWLAFWDPEHARSISKRVGAKVDVDDSTRTVVVDTTVDLPPLPSLDGDTWTLPAELVFGPPFFQHWTGPERDSAYVSSTTTFHRRTRIPLPEGWAGVLPKSIPRVEHERFAYHASVHVEDRHVVVDRIVTLLAGTTPPDDLFEMDAAITEVMALESRPIVLGRVGTHDAP